MNLILFSLFSSIVPASDDPSLATSLFCISVPFILVIVKVISDKKKQKEKQEKLQSEMNFQYTKAREEETNYKEACEKYRQKRNSLTIPIGHKVGEYKDSNNKSCRLPSGKVLIWKNDNDLYFFPDVPTKQNYPDYSVINALNIYSVPISGVEHFTAEGEILRENKISGGGGGGVNLGGAIVGGIIAGEVGAMIGSRAKVDAINSTLVTHDYRETVLNYFENSTRYSMHFDHATSQILNDLIPEKEFNIVKTLKTEQIIQSQKVGDEKQKVTDQLRELMKLKEEGIITDQEFAEKKKILLDKII